MTSLQALLTEYGDCRRFMEALKSLAWRKYPQNSTIGLKTAMGTPDKINVQKPTFLHCECTNSANDPEFMVENTSSRYLKLFSQAAVRKRSIYTKVRSVYCQVARLSLRSIVRAGSFDGVMVMVSFLGTASLSTSFCALQIATSHPASNGRPFSS